MNPLLLAIASDCSFVARGFSGDVEHLSQLIRKGMVQKGFALIDILQPCVSFNRVNTFQWYKKRVYKLDDEPDYDPENRNQAFDRAQQWGERIPIGVLYRTKRATLDQQTPAIKEGPLVGQMIDQAAFGSIIDTFR
jgi:2-oxoglutarate ferredoxin oxidoreductase subunit beta